MSERRERVRETLRELRRTAAAFDEAQRRVEDTRRGVRRAVWHMRLALAIYLVLIVALLWLIFHFA